MALSATIFKIVLQIADMDRHYYADHQLTLARHPSETDERMILRLLFFALYADERLCFTKGISTQEEPDLWNIDETNAITTWIELGLPDVQRIRRACGRAQTVVIGAYGGRNLTLWRERDLLEIGQLKNLTVLEIPTTQYKKLGEFVSRSMNLQCTIQEGQVWLSDCDRSQCIELQQIYPVL